MKTKNKKFTAEKNAALNAAENEAFIKPYEFLEEIKPLLKDYFWGDFSLDGTALNVVLPNGQRFKLITQNN